MLDCFWSKEQACEILQNLTIKIWVLVSQVTACRISSVEFEHQKQSFTKQEVDKLVASPEYQKHVTRCRMWETTYSKLRLRFSSFWLRNCVCSRCWSVWYLCQFSSNCEECGGFGMIRPCPVCEGRCGVEWKRDVSLVSHSIYTHAYNNKTSVLNPFSSLIILWNLLFSLIVRVLRIGVENVVCHTISSSVSYRCSTLIVHS